MSFIYRLVLTSDITLENENFVLDKPHISVAQSDVQRMQTELMGLVIQDNMRLGEVERRALWHYLCTDRPQDPDPCTWRGVDCTDGILTTFLMTQVNYNHLIDGQMFASRFLINLEWLPSTLQCVRIRKINLYNGLSTSHLPRDSRFFMLEHCSNMGFNYDINFNKLPSQIEELDLIGCWVQGTVLIEELPKSMHVLVISNQYIERVYIDSEKLPFPLEKIIINCYDTALHKKVRLIEVSSSKMDERIIRNAAYTHAVSNTSPMAIQSRMRLQAFDDEFYNAAQPF